MQLRLNCANGHEWLSDDERESACPVCRAKGFHSPRDETGLTGAAATPSDLGSSDLGPKPEGDWPRLAGYEFVSKLGEGGMGVVFKARQANLRRPVAIKTLKAGIHAGPKALARFRTEAEAVAALQHPNIVGIYEVGEQDGRPYFSMEYVGGGSLDRQLETGPLPLREAVRLVEKLSRAMHHAHERGIVHRDLKPANVLLMRDDTVVSGEARNIRSAKTTVGARTPGSSPHSDDELSYVPKIADFGLAKRLEAELAMTLPEERLGTPAYMAPEQLAGRHAEVGPATDVYALGAILYECLSGHRPLRDPGGPDIVSPAYYCPVPRDLETIVLKCLRAEPADRYTSAADLADDLRRFLFDEPIRGRRVGRLRRTYLWAKRRPLRTMSGLVTIGLCVLAAFWVRHQYLYAWESVTYFKSYAKRFGVPYGIGELTPDQVGRRYNSYKFVRAGRDGRLKYAEVVNARGKPTWDHEVEILLEGIRENLLQHEHECRYQYDYDEHGDVVEEAGYNSAGERIWRFNYFYADNPGEDRRLRVKARFHNAQGDVVTAPSGANTILFVRNADGTDERALYLNSDGDQPRPVTFDTYGVRFEYDEFGQIVRMVHLDAAERDAPNMHGISAIRLHYNADRLIDELFNDWAEGPPDEDLSVCRRSLRYDSFGNLTEDSYRNSRDALVEMGDGWAVQRTRYDDRGNPVESELLDASEKPIEKTKTEFDADGFPTARTTESVDDGESTVVTFDRHGNKTKEVYKSTTESPPEIATWKHDSLGRATDKWEWSPDEKTSISHTAWRYGRRAKPEAEQHFTTEGDREILSDEIRYQYDPRGLVTLEEHFDGDGRPRRCSDGYIRLSKEYDDLGFLKQDERFGFDRPDGVVKITKRYDRMEQVVEEAYWDGANPAKPRRNADGYLRATYAYLDGGSRIETTKWDYDGSLGFTRMLETVDSTNSRITTTFADDEGRPVATKTGNKAWIRQFTGDAELQSETYSGYEGVEDFTEYTVTYEPPGSGRRSTIAFRGCDGTLGIDTYTLTFEPPGGPVKNWTGEGYDGRRGFATLRRTFDERQLVIAEEYLDERRRPVLCANGYARFDCTYDDEQRLKSVRFSDLAGRPVHPKLNVVIAWVEPESAGQKLGLQTGDILVRYNGAEMPVFIALMNEQARISELRDKVPMEIVRDGKPQTLEAPPGKLGILLEERLVSKTSSP